MIDSLKSISRRRFLKQSLGSSAVLASSSLIPLSLGGCEVGQDNHKYSIVIKNGLIYDGTESPPIKSDIGIIDDKIVFIGEINESAKDGKSV